jgi:hypothetical protein
MPTTLFCGLTPPQVNYLLQKKPAPFGFKNFLIIEKDPKKLFLVTFCVQGGDPMKATEVSKKSTFKREPLTLFCFGRGKCPQTGSNCGFIRKTCKVYCWLK